MKFLDYVRQKSKKVLSAALAVVVSFSLIGSAGCFDSIIVFAKGKKASSPKLLCSSYVVMDAGSGDVLFSQKPNKKIYPASTAKLMNAIVCLENGDINDKFKTDYDSIHLTPLGSYSVGLSSGVTFSFKQLLSLSLIASAADATCQLAVHVFGSRKKAGKAMTAKAKELGLTHTSFDNPVGSDHGSGFPKTYSTAKEMTEIARYAMSIPEIRDIVKKKHYVAHGGQTVEVNNTNKFLTGIYSYSKDKYKIIGTKTGTTNAAGNVLIATAMDDEGHEVICGWFGGNFSGKEDVYYGIRKLFDLTFREYRKGHIKLTNSAYDVRCRGELSETYETYASLKCYPESATGSGRFSPAKGVYREELATMMTGINCLSAKEGLETFVQGNKNNKVTSLRLAQLIEKLMPSYMDESEAEEILENQCGSKDVLGDDATEEEIIAFASFLKQGFAVDDALKNPHQIVTRKNALLICDALSDYQLQYYAAHPRDQMTLDVLGQGKKGTEAIWSTMKDSDLLENLNIKWQKALLPGK